MDEPLVWSDAAARDLAVLYGVRESDVRWLYKRMKADHAEFPTNSTVLAENVLESVAEFGVPDGVNLGGDEELVYDVALFVA